MSNRTSTYKVCNCKNPQHSGSILKLLFDAYDNLITSIFTENNGAKIHLAIDAKKSQTTNWDWVLLFEDQSELKIKFNKQDINYPCQSIKIEDSLAFSVYPKNPGPGEGSGTAGNTGGN